MLHDFAQLLPAVNESLDSGVQDKVYYAAFTFKFTVSDI